MSWRIELSEWCTRLEIDGRIYGPGPIVYVEPDPEPAPSRETE